MNNQSKKKLEVMALPPEVSIERTIEKYGYDPRQLKPWSRKRVVAICFVSKKECTPTRCSLNLSKSIKETGHFVSHSGTKNKKGKTPNMETKIKMRTAQRKRRALEKEKREQELNEASTNVIPLIDVNEYKEVA